MTKSLWFVAVCASLMLITGGTARALPPPNAALATPDATPAAAAGAAGEAAPPADLGSRVSLLDSLLHALGAAAADPAAGDADSGYNWFRTVDKTQAEQPHWMTPIITVTPRLEEEVRYDQVWQARAANADLTNYGNNKGVELIPLEPIELILGIPGYETLDKPTSTKQGWADETFLLKYRVLSSNEDHGNYILTAFLGASLPTGGSFTNGVTIWTPTIAAGKGWGTRTNGLDVQSTLGIAIPASMEKAVGTTTTWNTAFQAHIFEEHLWPELELNYTHFHDGENGDHNQLMYTIGLVAGRFPITGRLRLALGAGYEQAVTAFRTFNHAWVLTLRTPF